MQVQNEKRLMEYSQWKQRSGTIAHSSIPILPPSRQESNGAERTTMQRRIDDVHERTRQNAEHNNQYDQRSPGVHPIKINAVAIRNFSEEEVLDFVRFARRKAYVMRWIEFMPLDADQQWRKDDILPGSEIKALISLMLRLTRHEKP